MEDKKTNIKFNIIAIISIIIFAFAMTPKTLQNDTFYTLKIGEYILDNGITMQDPFSWHNISYTYPHWAYDVMMYLIFNLAGYLGIYLSTFVFASILAIIMYFTNDKFTNNKPISFVLTIAALFLLRNSIAARAQLVTFIFFSLELLFIEGFLETKKKKYIFGLIIIPILIANFHVAVFPFYFVLYLPYIAEYIIALLSDLPQKLTKKKLIKIKQKIENETNSEKINNLTTKIEKLKNKEQVLERWKSKEPYKIKITNRKNTVLLIIIMIICIFTGLLTPLKSTPYTYLVKTMQGDSTKNISEHLPLTLANNLTFGVILMFYISMISFTDVKIRLCDLFMLMGLTVLAFMSRRQESMFIIMCIPIFNRMLTSFLNKYDKDGIKQMKKIMASLFGGFITICLVLMISVICYNNRYKDEYVNKNTYPVEASEWILQNLDINNIKLYNEYNFGSYLLLKGIPVFVDSRADLYLPEFNENITVFKDFLTISGLNTRHMEEMFEKYGFTHFITTSGAKLRVYLESQPDKYNRIYLDSNFCIYEKL